MLKLKKDLFDLTKDQIETSKMIYENKIIKCLVAPYHTFAQIEQALQHTPNMFVFPEKELSSHQVSSFVSMLVANKKFEEYNIITASQSIIIDMVDSSVRILTEKGDIVPCPIKTFMANIHSIRYEILENESYRLSKTEQSQAKEKINKLIEKINKAKSFDIKQYKDMMKEIELIGEPIIGNKLKQMLGDKLKK